MVKPGLLYFGRMAELAVQFQLSEKLSYQRSENLPYFQLFGSLPVLVVAEIVNKTQPLFIIIY